MQTAYSTQTKSYNPDYIILQLLGILIGLSENDTALLLVDIGYLIRMHGWNDLSNELYGILL